MHIVIIAVLFGLVYLGTTLDDTSIFGFGYLDTTLNGKPRIRGLGALVIYLIFAILTFGNAGKRYHELDGHMLYSYNAKGKVVNTFDLKSLNVVISKRGASTFLNLKEGKKTKGQYIANFASGDSIYRLIEGVKEVDGIEIIDKRSVK